MAKNRNKRKAAAAAAAMAVDVSTSDYLPVDKPQAMETSEAVAPTSNSFGESLRKTKQGRPMKRSKNVRKMKAVAKAISKTEKLEERSCKSESKTIRIKSSKNLYD